MVGDCVREFFVHLSVAGVYDGKTKSCNKWTQKGDER